MKIHNPTARTEIILISKAIRGFHKKHRGMTGNQRDTPKIMVKALEDILAKHGAWPNKYNIGQAGMTALWRVFDDLRGNFEFHKFCYELMLKHRTLTDDADFKRMEEVCLRYGFIESVAPPIPRSTGIRVTRRKPIPGARGIFASK